MCQRNGKREQETTLHRGEMRDTEKKERDRLPELGLTMGGEGRNWNGPELTDFFPIHLRLIKRSKTSHFFICTAMLFRVPRTSISSSSTSRCKRKRKNHFSLATRTDDSFKKPFQTETKKQNRRRRGSKPRDPRPPPPLAPNDTPQTVFCPFSPEQTGAKRPLSPIWRL